MTTSAPAAPLRAELAVAVGLEIGKMKLGEPVSDVVPEQLRHTGCSSLTR